MPERGESRRPSTSALEQAIREADWNMTRLAERLCVSRQTVYAWIRQLDLAAAVAVRRQAQKEVMQHPRGCTWSVYVGNVGGSLTVLRIGVPRVSRLRAGTWARWGTPLETRRVFVASGSELGRACSIHRPRASLSPVGSRELDRVLLLTVADAIVRHGRKQGRREGGGGVGVTAEAKP
jgi:hypothetical protein